jgi:pyruvate dehydrogenase E2 component (dihydrolipoamide acetyltransferase)
MTDDTTDLSDLFQQDAKDDRAPSSTPSTLRSAIVANIEASWRQIPHINIVGDLDAAGLVESYELSGKFGYRPKVTLTDLILQVVASALRAHPSANALDGKPASAIHIALAVESPLGVVAPVIRNVDKLTLGELAAERYRLVQLARAMELDPASLSGATCSLSNLGVYPVDWFTPVISGPQAALITAGRLRQAPVVDNGQILIGHRLCFDVALDHRAADGAVGGRVLQSLSNAIAALPDQVGNELRSQKR